METYIVGRTIFDHYAKDDINFGIVNIIKLYRYTFSSNMNFLYIVVLPFSTINCYHYFHIQLCLHITTTIHI